MAHNSRYGQAMGNQDAGYQDAALVIADVTAAGDVTTTTTIAVEDVTLPPCPIWSADGRWVAFGAGARNRAADPHTSTRSGWLTPRPRTSVNCQGSKVSDIEWAPDATELYIASDSIVVYSVANGRVRV